LWRNSSCPQPHCADAGQVFNKARCGRGNPLWRRKFNAANKQVFVAVNLREIKKNLLKPRLKNKAGWLIDRETANINTEKKQSLVPAFVSLPGPPKLIGRSKRQAAINTKK
jgi:hypothetical protein